MLVPIVNISGAHCAVPITQERDSGLDFLKRSNIAGRMGGLLQQGRFLKNEYRHPNVTIFDSREFMRKRLKSIVKSARGKHSANFTKIGKSRLANLLNFFKRGG